MEDRAESGEGEARRECRLRGLASASRVSQRHIPCTRTRHRDPKFQSTKGPHITFQPRARHHALAFSTSITRTNSQSRALILRVIQLPICANRHTCSAPPSRLVSASPRSSTANARGALQKGRGESERQTTVRAHHHDLVLAARRHLRRRVPEAALSSSRVSRALARCRNQRRPTRRRCSDRGGPDRGRNCLGYKRLVVDRRTNMKLIQIGKGT